MLVVYFSMPGLDVGAVVPFDAQLFAEVVFRAEEPHGQQDELARHDLFRARNLLRHELAFVVLLPFDFDGLDLLQVALRRRRSNFAARSGNTRADRRRSPPRLLPGRNPGV